MDLVVRERSIHGIEALGENGSCYCMRICASGCDRLLIGRLKREHFCRACCNKRCACGNKRRSNGGHLGKPNG